VYVCVYVCAFACTDALYVLMGGYAIRTLGVVISREPRLFMENFPGGDLGETLGAADHMHQLERALGVERKPYTRTLVRSVSRVVVFFFFSIV